MENGRIAAVPKGMVSGDPSSLTTGVTVTARPPSIQFDLVS